MSFASSASTGSRGQSPATKESAELPGLSVVIPCLNAAPYLETQLAALAGQRWGGFWEVIVADNGSNDGSRQLVERFARERLPNLRLVDACDRRGQAHARNLGAAAARGELLVFCDADDEVAPGWLEAMGQALLEHDFVACRYDFERLNPPWVWRSRYNPQGEGLAPYDYPPFLPHAGGGGLGVKRRLHQAAGGFDETLPLLEDTDYCWRLQLAGTPMHFVPAAVVHVRHRPDLASMFRQALLYGQYNVWIYQRYRDRGMPHLPWTRGAVKWLALIARLPWLLHRAGRARWLWLLGWRLGRLRGCVTYRVGAL